MRPREINPKIERVVFVLLAIGCSIWILQYDIILLMPVLGIVASVRELRSQKDKF